MKLEHLELREEGGLFTITLNRPKAANAIDMEMARELMRVAIHCDQSADVRAVLLDATGKFFCAGGDLKSFVAAGEALPALLKELTTNLHGAISRLSRMRAPLVVAVQGPAAGAGMSLAVSGDLVLAAESATFTSAYTAAGVSPDGSSTYFLPRLIGLRRTQELMLTNRRLSAAEALDWGLVTQVVPDAELADQACALAGRLAQGPTRALGRVKQLLHESFQGSLETQMERESRGIAEMGAGLDGPEGIRAFTEKRKPEFEGR